LVVMPPRGLPDIEEIRIRRLAAVVVDSIALALVEGYDEVLIAKDPLTDAFELEFFQGRVFHAAAGRVEVGRTTPHPPAHTCPPHG